MVDRRTEEMLGRVNDMAQWEALDEASDWLHELEDRLNVVFPTPDTPTGAAQRLRIGVPTPETVLTLGSKRSNHGRTIGPSGIALRTVQNLGVEIQGSTVIDTDGLTITHSLRGMRMLTQADLGIAAKTAIHMGTEHGNIEISAGEVEAPDPAFTVVPSMEVPEEAPEVDTESPRERTLSVRERWELVSPALEAIIGVTAIYGSRHTPQAPSVADHAMQVLTGLTSAYGVMHAAISGLVDTVLSQASRAAGGESEEPKVLVHGAGAVDISSPHEVKAWGQVAVELASLNLAKVEAGLKAVLQSPVYAAVLGGRMATLASEGVAMVSGHHAVVSGHTTDLIGRDVVGLTSGEKVLVHSDGETVVEAKEGLAIGGKDVHASAGQELHLSSKQRVLVEGANRLALVAGDEAAMMTLGDTGAVTIKADNGQNKLEMDGNEIRLKPGGAAQLVASRDEVKVGQHVSVRRGEVSIRAPRINLG